MTKLYITHLVCIIILDLFTDEELEQYLIQNPTTEATSAGQEINPVNTYDFSYGLNPPGNNNNVFGIDLLNYNFFNNR